MLNMHKLKATHPFSFVLFGASGHLAQLKLYPALFTLLLTKRMPAHWSVVGFSRTELTDESFRALVGESIRTHVPEVNEALVQEFLEHVFYQPGQYDSKDDFQLLAKRLHELEQGWELPVRLAYFSVPPAAFSSIARNLCDGGVREEGKPIRLIVEKPVGSNLETFQQVKDSLTTCFTEEEIYLLDHYLGKESVRNIYYLRFANPVVERMLKNTLIHSVQVSAFETHGIEGRSGYFEHTGTFRDMFQSHLLMMMSLLTMRLREEGGSFRESRLDALRQLYLPPVAKMDDLVLQGQYAAGRVGNADVVGYSQEEGVKPNSRTNTYAAMRLSSRTSRWQGVPFYLRSGKRLPRKETQISILFQEPHKVGPGSALNRLDIIMQGEAGMRLHLQTKVGGTDPLFRPLVLADPLVCTGDCMPEHALLLLEAIHGKTQWYLSFDEVQTAWRLLDPVQAYLDQPASPLHLYASGTNGPKEADDWMALDGMQWL